MSSPITRSRDAAVWVLKNPVLPSGAYGIEEDTGKVKQGDGTSNWSALPYLDTPPYTLPIVASPWEMSDSELKATFISVVDAGSNLSKARPPGAIAVLWKFNAGVNVGTNGANVVNRQAGDLVFVASA